MTHVSDDELHNGQLLGIGEASQLCGITSRTLRHYDKLNLLQPDCIGDNKYRYYGTAVGILDQNHPMLLDPNPFDTAWGSCNPGRPLS